MFFYLSKILWFAASPANIVVGLCVLGSALLWTGWKRLGRGIALAGGVGVLLLGISALPRALLRPLEDRFPIVAQETGRQDIKGIVVLGGGLGTSRGQIVLSSSASRIIAAAALAQKHPEAKLVFSGGNPSIINRDRTPEAEVAGAVFQLFNIPAERLVLEERSRNTRENALFTRKLIAPKAGERWVLITSAFHMPRAMGCFREVGWELEPYPVDFMTEGRTTDYWRPFGDVLLGLIITQVAVKEWIGLVAYRLVGYTTQLFPRPYPDGSVERT